MPQINVNESARSCGEIIEVVSESSATSRRAVPHELIGDIYDAVLDASLWPSLLEKAACFVGGPAASLFSKDAASKSGTLVYEHGVDPHYTRLYFEKYVRFDPVNSGQFFAPIGEPVATADVMPYEEFLATRFYREWAEPQGFVDFVASVLERSASSVAMFGVFRDRYDGIVNEETRERMRLITPHIRRAVLIGKVIDLGHAKAATFHEVFDGLTAGIFLVDAGGRVIHANVAGREILARADLLRSAHGRLAACEPTADRALRGVYAAAAKGDAAVGSGGIAVPLVASDGENHVAHVLPMNSGARHGLGGDRAAVAALFVHKATIDAPSMPEAIARHYKLTPTELRVLRSLLDVGSGPEVADALGIAESTVKTHLGRIYQKTGTRRQLDLAKLVAGFANPLVG